MFSSLENQNKFKSAIKTKFSNSVYLSQLQE